MPTPMELLLLATGFTGALTLRWLLGLVVSRSPSSATPHFAPAAACAEVIAREISAARSEVVLMASVFSCRPVAQALVEARLRGVAVEVVLDAGNETDPGSEMHFLVEQGLPPMLDDQHPVAHNLVVIDGRHVLTGNFTFTQADSPITEDLLVVHGDAALASAYRQEFAAHKAHARAVPAKTATPAPTPQDDVLAAVAQNLVEGELPAEEPDEAAPVVTPASAELFARLRQELATAGEDEAEAPGKGKKAG
jgi:phosphatidylserine/phosphatidylglycerophosphate/cardiolipin synthase-like enzyme